MFDLLPNFWTPVLPVAEVENTPVAVELAGERLVLFRNLTGEIGALLDRCPHRGVALSLGRVNENGCLECPYHGWQFDQNGACRHVPLNNPADVKLSVLSAVSLPTRIIAGLVWVFTGQGEVPDLEVPESLMRSPEFYFIHHEVWNVHWTRVVENAMDYVHVPFVHRNSFGGEVGQAIKAGSFAEFQITQTKHSVQIFNRYHNIESGFAFEWHQPNLVVLKFDEMGMPVRSHFFAIPINQYQTRILIAIQLLEPHAVAMLDEFITPIIEDKVVIESHQGEIPATTGECNVPTDRATLLFRRWYHQAIARQAVTI
ncbi:aromatic ring-hydroxylating oxygenase subunit alpha [Anabaena lutea]|uniref:Aromatic ring-hydroxylating dioxygenase subunit alpha n=1 Tax=Anabaena lutea FACHB-196 TaxID=2692881 RepID=A0ABR8FG66_9NOST|nr:aromatic ring-hydroxylating dioxygenase subunit alpha [Anabaena lutea]MBD2568830.1 aromatic ring-hydroxylating dioxygenase subunit alpha [Anabaena lutea FACHB-196]